MNASRKKVWAYSSQLMGYLIAGILVIVIGYAIDVRSLQKKLEMSQKQIVGLKQQISDKKKVMQQEHAGGSLPAKADAVTNFGVEMANIMTLLEKAMFESKVEPYLFEPLPLRENQGFMTYPLKLELDGGYRNLLSFLNHVLHLPDLTVIDDLVLQKKTPGDGDELNMRMALTVYKNKFITPKKPPAISANNLSIDTKARDIFNQASREDKLYLWSSRELRFLGLVKEKQTTFGIISDPMGGVYQVTIGDKIGLNQSKITAINKCEIVTTNPKDNISRGDQCN